MKYKSLVLELGYPSALVIGVEVDRLIPLPSELRKYYEQVGGMPFNLAHNRLCEPNQLKVEDGKIAFLSENQNVCVWGVEPDTHSILFQGVGLDGEFKWSPESMTLSDFLQQMIFLQTVFGGFKVACMLEDEDDLQKLVLGMTPYRFSEMTGYTNGNIAVCVLGRKGERDIFLAAQSEEEMERFEKSTKVVFSWL